MDLEPHLSNQNKVLRQPIVSKSYSVFRCQPYKNQLTTLFLFYGFFLTSFQLHKTDVVRCCLETTRRSNDACLLSQSQKIYEYSLL